MVTELTYCLLSVSLGYTMFRISKDVVITRHLRLFAQWFQMSHRKVLHWGEWQRTRKADEALQVQLICILTVFPLSHTSYSLLLHV